MDHRATMHVAMRKPALAILQDGLKFTSSTKMGRRESLIPYCLPGRDSGAFFSFLQYFPASADRSEGENN